MNPAISMIGNVLGAAGHNPVDQRPAFNVVESELALSAAVDPYAKADVYLTFGEEGVEVEEAYMTFTALPGSLAESGKDAGEFRKSEHAAPARAPLGRPAAGKRVPARRRGWHSRHGILDQPPASVVWRSYLDATGELYRGNSSVIFQQQSRNDLTTVGHLRAYRDLSESTNLDLGFSFSRGHHAPAEVSGPM